jgi:hypothetical protein
MANRSSNSAPQPYEHRQPNSGAVRRINRKPEKSSQQGNKLVSMVAIAVLLSSAGIIAIFAWIGIQFIYNPEKAGWLNVILPEWAKVSLGGLERPLTLEQIQASLSKKEQIAGNRIALEADTEKSFLLPVFKETPNCVSNCKSIVELRIYQRSQDFEFASTSKKYYYLAAQLPVTGLEESFVVASLGEEVEDSEDSSKLLPISEIGRFEEGAPSPGLWFYLRGQHKHEKNTIAYGEVVYYNPNRSYLKYMTSWASPDGKLPQWQQVTGDSRKELVVDETLSLEPYLRVYQIKPVNYFFNPIQLEEISLEEIALKDSAYQNALALARGRLWTPALDGLQFLTKQHPGRIPALVRAQIDVIDLHSQLTKAQADKNWVSPSQQALADIIDGRWEKALQVFEASPQNAQEIFTLLKADQGRLWNRVKAALDIIPDRRAVQAWGALILTAKYGTERGITWLKAQSQVSEDSLTYIQSLLAQSHGEGIQ